MKKIVIGYDLWCIDSLKCICIMLVVYGLVMNISSLNDILKDEIFFKK